LGNKKGVSWVLAMMMILQLFFAYPAQASEKITWGEVRQGVYENLHPFTLHWSGNIMQDGSLSLATMEVTDDRPEADIIINQYGAMGANGILQLEEDLEDPTDSDLNGFVNSVDIETGAVYLVILHDGTYAKIRIDRFLPESGMSISKVFFSYVLEDAGSGNADQGRKNDGSAAIHQRSPRSRSGMEREGTQHYAYTGHGKNDPENRQFGGDS